MGPEILIVDDEDAVRLLFKLMFRTMNVSVREASDGVEALNEIAARKPSLVILDVMMPRMDGLSVLKKLRADPATEKLPVLLFTAFRVPAAEAEQLNMPPHMIMSKGSMSVMDIRAAVNQVLQLQGAT